MIFIFGFFPEHINDVATNRNVGGGPFESMSRTLKAEMPTTPLAESAGSKRSRSSITKRVVDLPPRRERHPRCRVVQLDSFVAEGFNISTEYLLVNLLVTFGYLLPWAILAYYLMRMREVAA